MNDFERALQFVLKWEGDLTDPSPGYDGNDETHHGIDESKNPDLEVENLTDEQIREIYRKRYWTPCRCDTLCCPECLVVFDTAVNCGVSRAQKWLRDADQIGYREILLKRIAHYTTLAKNTKYRVYFRGWMNRVMDLYRVACED